MDKGESMSVIKPESLIHASMKKYGLPYIDKDEIYDTATINDEKVIRDWGNVVQFTAEFLVVFYISSVFLLNI